eukprot:12015669-Alexandrium_andersonii.AAC.1
MLGYEAMVVQGFPRKILDRVTPEQGTSDPQLVDLAGNAFSSTVFGAMLVGALATMPLEKRFDMTVGDPPEAQESSQDQDDDLEKLAGWLAE